MCRSVLGCPMLGVVQPLRAAALACSMARLWQWGGDWDGMGLGGSIDLGRRGAKRFPPPEPHCSIGGLGGVGVQNFFS